MHSKHTKMKHLSHLLFLMIIPLLPLSGQEKSVGYELKFHIKDAKKEIFYLTYQIQESAIPLDSVALTFGEMVTFAGNNNLPSGMYELVGKESGTLLSFIIDDEAHFQYNLDASRNPLNFKVENSEANSVMLDYQQKLVTAQQRLHYYQYQANYFSSHTLPDSVNYYRKAIYDLNIEVNDYTSQLIKTYPDMLFVKMQKALQIIEIPENREITDHADLEAYQLTYYIEHYWDNFDFRDARLIAIPVLHQRLNSYVFDYLFSLEYEDIISNIDLFIAKSAENPDLYYYFIDRLCYDFEQHLLPYHDAVYIYLTRKYRLRKDFPWESEDERDAAIKKMNRFEPFLIGKKTPELVMTDTSGQRYFSTYHTQKEYTIIWFVDPECELCSLESEKLRTFYLEAERNGTRNFEVYCVGIDKDFDRWKRYVREKKYPWINVGGNQASVNYIEAFNVLGNPWMVIIDADKNIVLNKRVEIEKIPKYIKK